MLACGKKTPTRTNSATCWCLLGPAGISWASAVCMEVGAVWRYLWLLQVDPCLQELLASLQLLSPPHCLCSLACRFGLSQRGVKKVNPCSRPHITKLPCRIQTCPLCLLWVLSPWGSLCLSFLICSIYFLEFWWRWRSLIGAKTFRTVQYAAWISSQ